MREFEVLSMVCQVRRDYGLVFVLYLFYICFMFFVLKLGLFEGFMLDFFLENLVMWVFYCLEWFEKLEGGIVLEVEFEFEFVGD